MYYKVVGVIYKIHKKGLAWAVSRIKVEFRTPSFRLTRGLINVMKAAEANLKGLIKKPHFPDESSNYLTAIYDLNVHPITYDFAYFLAGAELYANKQGKSKFFVWIVLRDGRLRDVGLYEQIVDQDNLNWRFDNIVVPLIPLCSACIGYAVVKSLPDIEETIKYKPTYPEFYGKRYHPSFDYREFFLMAKQYHFNGLRASMQGIKYIKGWRDENSIYKPIVTITIRNYGYDQGRDSLLSEWITFARLISKNGFSPVFLPDTDEAFTRTQKFEDFLVFREPCWNIGLRIALYEESYLNFFVPSGPGALAQLNKRVSYICMKMHAINSLWASKEMYKDRGIEFGMRKYSFANNNQILSWKEDFFENICEEFYGFVDANPIPLS